MNYFEVNLPTPSEKLLDMVRVLKDSQPRTNPLRYQPVLDAAGPSINAAECLYFGNDEIDAQTLLEFKDHFSDPCAVMIMTLRNHDLSRPAFYPPHQDTLRTMTLNYVIDQGGNDVETWTYKQVGSYDDLTGKLVSYDNAEIHKKYKLNESRWYALDVVRYHSVQNISTDRLILSLSFANLSLDEFYKKYPNLVGTVL